MTDPSVERGSSDQNHDNIEDAVVVDETVSDDGTTTTASPLVEPEVESPTTASPSASTTDSGYGDATVEAEAEPLAEPVVEYEPEIVAEPETNATGTSSTSTAGEPRVVYMTAPTPPKAAGNRGFGVFIALVATLVFAIVFAIAVAVVNAVQAGRVDVGFVQQPAFYVPIAFFALGALIIALIVNRAGWAAHVFGSIIVGLVVYFGTVGVLLLANGVIQNTPEQAQLLFALALIDPRVIAGGLIAREVSLWTGALVAKRGRKVTERNRESRTQWEAELAEKSAAQR
ncbi:MAG: hypothetical protein ACOH1M_09495 [Rhodoglobus sp.]